MVVVSSGRGVSRHLTSNYKGKSIGPQGPEKVDWPAEVLVSRLI